MAPSASNLLRSSSCNSNRISSDGNAYHTGNETVARRLALLAGGWAETRRRNGRSSKPGRTPCCLDKGWAENADFPGKSRIGASCGCAESAWLGGVSLACSITEENHATVKAAFLQKLELQSNVVRERWFAPSYDDRCEKQVTLVDQPCSKGVGSHLGT